MFMNEKAVYNTTNTQVLINPDKDGGNFLEELNNIIYEGKNAFPLQAFLYTPHVDGSEPFEYTRQASKYSTDTMYHLIGGDVLVICARESDGDNPLKILADDLDLYKDQDHGYTKFEDGLVLSKDLVPICKIWYNGDSSIPHVDFIEKHGLSFNPAKLYELAMKYSVNGNNKSEAMGSVLSEKPLDVISSTHIEIPLQQALS